MMTGRILPVVRRCAPPVRVARLLAALALWSTLLATSGCTNLTYRTVSGPDKPGCGGYRRDIEWRLKKPAPQDGWVVQKMTITFNLRTCDNAPDPARWPSRTYWEAWSVARGDVLSTPRNDRWFVPASPARKGTWSYKGEARFFPGAALPADMTPFNPNTYAGSLPATTSEPAFWGGKMVVRTVDVEFECCEHNAEHFSDSHDR